MKFKTTAIAMAVASAGTVAAPVAVQAGADEIYASARVGLWHRTLFDESENLAVRSFSSRFGARGETDLGNGMTGFGRYEWDVDFNNDDDGGSEDDISVRHRYVGLKGDFGSVLVGQTYHTFYNFAVGPTDIPWWHSGYNMVNYRSRTDNAITYAGGSGAVAFGLSAYFDSDPEEEEPDQIEVGASIDIGDMTLGGAIQQTADDTSHGILGSLDDLIASITGTTAAITVDGTDEDIIGIVLSGVNLGPTSWGFGYQMQDDTTSLLIHVDINNFYVHVEQLYLDADITVGGVSDTAEIDPLAITLGYTQSLGRKTTMYYEFFDWDPDVSGVDNLQQIMAVLKYDII